MSDWQGVGYIPDRVSLCGLVHPAARGQCRVAPSCDGAAKGEWLPFWKSGTGQRGRDGRYSGNRAEGFPEVNAHFYNSTADLNTFSAAVSRLTFSDFWFMRVHIQGRSHFKLPVKKNLIVVEW